MEFLDLLSGYITCLRAPPPDGVSKCLLSGWSLGDIGVLIGIIATVVGGIFYVFRKTIIGGFRKVAGWTKHQNVDAIISPKIETENPNIVGRGNDGDALLKLFKSLTRKFSQHNNTLPACVSAF